LRPREQSPSIIEKAKQVHFVFSRQKKKLIHEFQVARSGNYYERLYLNEVQKNPYLTEECLADLWISHDR
jgi:hypothetical protein